MGQFEERRFEKDKRKLELVMNCAKKRQENVKRQERERAKLCLKLKLKREEKQKNK